MVSRLGILGWPRVGVLVVSFHHQSNFVSKPRSLEANMTEDIPVWWLLLMLAVFVPMLIWTIRIVVDQP